jgi:hypothetical protein
MKYKVYLATEPNFGMGDHQDLEDMILVAEVDAQHYEEAFRLTQNGVLKDNWLDNEGVTQISLVSMEFRSFCVGDALLDENNVQYRCEILGWNAGNYTPTTGAAHA